MKIPVEHGVDQPLGHHPQPQDIAVVEHPGKLPFIAGPDLRGQRRVIVHSEVKVKRVHLLRVVALDPVFIKPVFGAFRVAVEPYLAPLDGAPGEGLFHEGPGHEHHLVQQGPGQGNALDQHIGALVPAAEQEVGVLPPQAV